MNVLTAERRIQVITCLVEGNSIRATSRMTGVAKGTILTLLCKIGKVCADYQNKTFRNLSCKRIQCDEIWSFCYAKDKRVSAENRLKFGHGDAWTYVAICADTKIVPCFLVGQRSLDNGRIFLRNLASRMTNRVQVTTDNHKVYVYTLVDAFKGNVDFATLNKEYGKDPKKYPDTRYSPFACIGTFPRPLHGNPDLSHVSTSYVERQNLTMRMSMRRFTRLSNGFSKKLENLIHAVSLHFMYYNFCRIHQSLRVTPAMEAGITSRLWSIEDIVNLLEK